MKYVVLPQFYANFYENPLQKREITVTFEDLEQFCKDRISESFKIFSVPKPIQFYKDYILKVSLCFKTEGDSQRGQSEWEERLMTKKNIAIPHVASDVAASSSWSIMNNGNPVKQEELIWYFEGELPQKVAEYKLRVSYTNSLPKIFTDDHYDNNIFF